MPLNKFIAHCGVCARRDAAEMVKLGKVKVNGELITEPGYKVTTERRNYCKWQKSICFKKPDLHPPQ